MSVCLSVCLSVHPPGYYVLVRVGRWLGIGRQVEWKVLVEALVSDQTLNILVLDALLHN